MDDFFAKIGTEKGNRVLNSALEEFAKAGFRRASTNAIVERADISKGLLFHYFGSKQQLYDALIEFAYRYVTELLENGINWKERDFFRRAEQIAELKLSAMQSYPYIYDFLKKAMQDLSMEEVKRRLPMGLTDISERVYTENIDVSLFRKDIDPGRTIDIIRWTVEGAAEKIWLDSTDGINMEDAVQEYREYVELLRTLVYQ